MTIRSPIGDDAPAVVSIYNHYIANSHATFEVEPIDANEMVYRIGEIQANDYPFLVYEDEGEVVGFAYANRYKARPAYRHSVEVSVYIRDDTAGKGIGTLLYEQLFSELKNGDLHAMIAGISLPNDASVKLHEKFGFEKVAHFREVGRKFDRWIDVGYWQRLLTK
ncbi:MAG: arsinothricin resistance N-acetyltransferase ArsN1 family B [Acidobacteriota bacterium]